MLFLQPGTSYEIRFTMVDPDGGSPAEPKIIEVSTRSEPQASEGGKTIHASPKSGLNLKLNNYPAGVLAYNNTLCCAQKGFTPPSIWQNGHFRNNLFMGGRGYAMETGTVTAYSTLDYNGYRRNSKEQFLKWRDPQRKTGRYQTLEAFHKATGYEEHGLEVDYDIFGGRVGLKRGKTYGPKNYDLQVKPKAKCVDAGVMIMQVSDNFTGSVPDLGCYEQGQSPPHYGPRLKRESLKTGP